MGEPMILLCCGSRISSEFASKGALHMNRSLKIGAVVIAAAALSGCLIPEKFDASISVKPDGSYTYRYDGTAVHFIAAAALKEKGSLLAKDEAGLKRDAETTAKIPGIKKLEYTGKGRFDVSIQQDMKPGQQVSVLKIFSMIQGKDGVYTITPPAMKAKDIQDLKSMDINVNGKAEVILPSNAKVISHNATGTPGIFSKSYTWKIGSIADQPSIKFTLTQ